MKRGLRNVPAYPGYNSSGIEWLGAIPTHWQVRKLKAASSLQTGVTLGKRNDSAEKLAIAANVGDMAILNFSACFPDSVVGFFPEHDVDLEYLYYLLTAMRQELVSASTTNTQANLNIDRVGSVVSVRPPLEEQVCISGYVEETTSRFDALSDKIGKAIDNLQEYRTSLISAAVTGKIDVREEVA